MDKISIIMNKNREINSIMEGMVISVFEKKDAVWTTVREVPMCSDLPENIGELRRELLRLASELEDCKIIVGKSFSGLPYHIFDKLGFAIFEAESCIPAVLDQILLDVHDKSRERKAVAFTDPAETDVPGVYFLDLIALQKQNPEISSKMALQPFLAGTPFFRLNLICEHLPPWMESLVQNKKLNLETEKLAQGKTRVSITKISCE